MSRRIALIYGPETPDGQAVVTSDYVVGTNDAVIAADASTDNPLIVTLPLAATRTLKSDVTVVKIDSSANPVSVIVQGADTISGVTSVNLSNQWDSLVVEAAGTGRWLRIQSGGGGGATDHGALTGLGDDDHKQYQLVDINLVTADSDFAAAGINPGTVLYAGSGSDLLTLPTPDADYSGRSYTIGVSNTATSSVDVDVEDASLINGSLATYTILPGSSVQFTCLDGAGLWITQLVSGTQFDLPNYSTATTNDVLQFGASGLPEWTDTVDLVNVTSNQVQFDTAATTTDAVGRLRWNATDQTLNLGLDANVTIRLGQILVQEVTNQHGSTLSPGEAVYVFGSAGNRLTVKKAQANSETTAAKTFGVVLESMANNGHGFVATYGLMRNINTSALTEGASVWLSAGTAGGLTTTRPDAPDHGVLIGFCVRSHAVNGELFVAVTNGQELNELHDVNTTSAVNNDSLVYQSSNSTWVPGKRGNPWSFRPIVSASNLDVITTNSGTLPWDSNGASTAVSMAAGQMWGCWGNVQAGTLSAFAFETTASSLTAGQSLIVACYALDGDRMPTGNPLWTQSVTHGTSFGPYDVATTNTLPDNGFFIAILNPSTNAGAVTIYRYRPNGPYLANTRTSLDQPAIVVPGMASYPDLTGWKLSSAGSVASSRLGLSTNAPMIFLRGA